jgi:hypothetical protein
MLVRKKQAIVQNTHYVISHGPWFLRTLENSKPTYGSLNSALVFPDIESASLFIQDNNLNSKQHQVTVPPLLFS